MHLAARHYTSGQEISMCSSSGFALIQLSPYTCTLRLRHHCSSLAVWRAMLVLFFGYWVLVLMLWSFVSSFLNLSRLIFSLSPQYGFLIQLSIPCIFISFKGNLHFQCIAAMCSSSNISPYYSFLCLHSLFSVPNITITLKVTIYCVQLLK